VGVVLGDREEVALATEKQPDLALG
jgi:hypothetical protein